MWRAFGFLVIATTLGCQPGSPPDVPESVEACEASGVVLDYYSCPEGPAKTPGYVDGCRRLAALGYVWPDAQSGPVCVRAATSIDAVRACRVECAR